MGKPVKLKLGLAEYELEFDADALMAFEEASGRSVLDVKKPRFSDIVYLLWAALRRKDPAITLEQVKNLFDMNRASEISRAVMQALNRTAGSEEAAGPLAPSASPGSS
jgi:hypothetical protein